MSVGEREGGECGREMRECVKGGEKMLKKVREGRNQVASCPLCFNEAIMV